MQRPRVENVTGRPPLMTGTRSLPLAGIDGPGLDPARVLRGHPRRPVAAGVGACTFVRSALKLRGAAGLPERPLAAVGAPLPEGG